MPKMVEWDSYISPDDIEYEFDNRVTRWLISETGWGTPPIDYITQRGPFQDGETVKDFFLAPRLIRLLVRNLYCNRTDYWAGRGDLLDQIRPNRQSSLGGVDPGHLRKYQPDGTIRQIDVFIREGPQFEPAQRNTWDHFSFQEMLHFVAYNPVIYDPASKSSTFSESDSGELEFPAKFFEEL